MRKFLLLAALCAVAASAPAEAQSKLEPPELDQYLRWGPFRVRPGFELANFGYDDNIFLDDSNRVSDLTVTLSPKLSGLLLFGSRAFWEFHERFDYTGYINNTDQNYLDHRGRGRVTVPLGRFGVFGHYRLDNYHQRPRDDETLRPKTLDRRLGFGLIVELGWRTDIEISQTGVGLRYEDPAGSNVDERLDRDERRRALRFRYLLKGRTSLTADFETSDIDFVSKEPLKDSDRWTILPGISLGRGGPLQGTIRVGWAEVDAFDPERPDFSDAIGDVTARYAFGNGTRLEVTGERIPGFTVIDSQTYYVSTAGTVRGIRFLNSFLGVEAGIGVGRLVFPETGEDGTDRVDRLREYDIGIRVRLAEDTLGRKTEYSIRLVNSERLSTVESINRTRTTLTVGAVLGF